MPRSRARSYRRDPVAQFSRRYRRTDGAQWTQGASRHQAEAAWCAMSRYAGLRICRDGTSIRAAARKWRTRSRHNQDLGPLPSSIAEWLPLAAVTSELECVALSAVAITSDDRTAEVAATSPSICLRVVRFSAPSCAPPGAVGQAYAIATA